jgi:hypothetical protein
MAYDYPFLSSNWRTTCWILSKKSSINRNDVWTILWHLNSKIKKNVMTKGFVRLREHYFNIKLYVISTLYFNIKLYSIIKLYFNIKLYAIIKLYFNIKLYAIIKLYFNIKFFLIFELRCQNSTLYKECSIKVDLKFKTTSRKLLLVEKYSGEKQSLNNIPCRPLIHVDRWLIKNQANA